MKLKSLLFAAMAIALLASGCKKNNLDPANPRDNELSNVFYLQKSLIGKDLTTAKQILEADGYIYEELGDSLYIYDKTVNGVEYEIAFSLGKSSKVCSAVADLYSESATSFLADNAMFLSWINSITELFTLPSTARVPFRYYKYYTVGGGNYDGDMWSDLINVITANSYEAIEIEWYMDPEDEQASCLYVDKEIEDGEYDIFIQIADKYYYN